MRSATHAVYGYCVRCGRLLRAGDRIWYEDGMFLCGYHPRRRHPRSHPAGPKHSSSTRTSNSTMGMAVGPSSGSPSV